MAKSTCNVDDCDRPAETRGMCGMHYKRARRGAPLQAPPLNDSPRDPLLAQGGPAKLR
jgi:hypothetical protein